MDKLVCVHWIDAESSSGWVDNKEIEEAMCPIVETVGWVVRDDDEVMAIAQTISGGDRCAVMYIPRMMVREVVELNHP